MDMDWDHYRYFLTIARTRSLTAAGKKLGVSQPTVSRRLDAMESRLKVRLFDRTTRGYELTAAGLEIFEAVEGIWEDLSGIERKVFGQDLRLTGSLRVTCTEVFLNSYLAPHVWDFLVRHPAIEFSIISTDAQLSLSRREADVAIRFTSSRRRRWSAAVSPRPPLAFTRHRRRLAGVSIVRSLNPGIG